MAGYKLSDGITQSMLSDFLACRKRMHLQLELWETKTTKASLRFGSMVHDALEEYYKAVRESGKLSPEEADVIFAKATAAKFKENRPLAINPNQVDEMRVEVLKARAVLSGYVLEWQDDFDRKWIEVENVFDVDFHGFKLRGRMDGLFKTKRGKFLLLETKTKARISENELSDKLNFDFQCLFYLTAMKQRPEIIGKPKNLLGVLYNIIRVPQLKQKPDETDKVFIQRITEDTRLRPDFYYKRFELSFPDELCLEFERNLLAKLNEYKMWLNGELATYQNQASCHIFWACEYMKMCSSKSEVGYSRTRVLFRELMDGKKGEKRASKKGRKTKKKAAPTKKRRRRRKSK